MLLIAYGDPFSGITLVGPFEDDEAAGNFAENNLRNFDWWVIRVTAPNEVINPDADEGITGPWDEDFIRKHANDN